MTLPALRVICAFSIAAMSLAGCGGGAQSPATSALPSSNGLQSAPMDGRTCHDSDGIKVMPCRVAFDAKHPGPKNVVVAGDNDRHEDRQTIKERDNCAARDVATVTRTSNHRYVVTAGSARGSCTATFVRGMHDNDEGHHPGADLTVVNAL